ncbi:hypothetical protein GGH99_000069 [Coemansia sp. RSA 1285]|nr:hypothetical protein GGH99_000069 [Coemansia sp. RSA 1285]
MSSYLIGVGAAVFGNVVIGGGQCMQKYALNKLQREWEARRELEGLEGGGGALYGTSTGSSAGSAAAMHATALDVRTRSGSTSLGSRGRHGAADGLGGRADSAAAAAAHGGPGPRYTSKAWILGLVMNYAGEVFGNSVALSYLSASVVAPLGIITVIVNLVLAERFLGERITPNQRYGFTVIMAGVGLILLVAPRKSAASDALQFVELVSTSGILGLFGMLFIVQTALISLIRLGRRESLFLYVLVASLFGAMNVMVSKILTTFMRLKLTFSAIPNPADIVFYGATQAAHARPLVLFLTGPQILAAIVMALSIVGQESFRQQALGRYSVMQFQPVFFATYNVVATLSGLLLFKELDGTAHALLFFSVFSLGIALILYGSRFLQKARSVVLPSHIRLHKENLGLKTL